MGFWMRTRGRGLFSEGESTHYWRGRSRCYSALHRIQGVEGRYSLVVNDGRDHDRWEFEAATLPQAKVIAEDLFREWSPQTKEKVMATKKTAKKGSKVTGSTKKVSAKKTAAKKTAKTKKAPAEKTAETEEAPAKDMAEETPAPETPKKSLERKKQAGPAEENAFSVYSATFPDGEVYQRRFKRTKAPVAVVVGRLEEDGRWVSICWSSKVSDAKGHLNRSIRQYVDESSPEFLEKRYKGIQMIDEVVFVRDQEPGEGQLPKEVREDRSWVRVYSERDRVLITELREKRKSAREEAKKAKAEAKAKPEVEESAQSTAPKSKKSSGKKTPSFLDKAIQKIANS